MCHVTSAGNLATAVYIMWCVSMCNFLVVVYVTYFAITFALHAQTCTLGLRILDGGETTDAREASALGFNTESIDIYSSSWGPYDSGFIADGPGPLLTDTFQRGAKEVYIYV